MSEGESFSDLAEQGPKDEDRGLLYTDCGRYDLAGLGVDQFSYVVRIWEGGFRLSGELG